ncbi:MAG: pyruvate kinase [Candidatus Marinimicrobia bacterium]|nr:pyruvate kinase [Candidatus Neomarinimicrobiota bacterium]
MKRTKIVCTIGPASNRREILLALVQAGMNVARLNFSHGTHEEHGVVIRLLREISAEMNQPVAILQDIAGPKIRVGKMANGPVPLEAGQPFTITSRDVPGDKTQVSVNFKQLPVLVQPGDRLLLSDGMLEMKVQRVMDQDILCRVIVGGALNAHKGINLPTRSTGIPILTEKDYADLEYGIAQDVDYIALSFVRSLDDIMTVRRVLDRHAKDIPVIAKIEKPEALEHMDEILPAVDGLMVARGDLGVELPFEQVPLIQKQLIEMANAASKPVITATQMLESMVTNPRPTRAEVNDVANAILDGTDAVMLSEESALGRYPVQAVEAMARIAADVEKQLPFKSRLPGDAAPAADAVALAVAQAACHIAQRLDVAAIIATTTTGLTARQMARFRPPKPILAPTPRESTYRRLALVWGVTPLLIPPAKMTDQVIETAFRAAVAHGLLERGQRAVISAGVPVTKPGQTNFLAVLEAGRDYGPRYG